MPIVYRIHICALALALLPGCQLEFGLPEGLVVSCSAEAPCSAGYICSEQHQVCVTKEPICGNGEKEFPESCDDGFQDACGSCNATCNGPGTASVCGDSITCPEFETCDDGYEDSCGTCNSNCTGPGDGSQCGDNSRCPETETCDDGFKTECGSCNADCTAPGEGYICGDGLLCEDFESCDDGNTENESCGYGNVSCTHVVMDEGGPGCGQTRTWEVGSKPLGVSPYGAHDMIGNVYEWTADWFDESYYAAAPESNPPGPTNEDEALVYRVLRGGSWPFNDAEDFRASFRFFNSPSNRFTYIGFRCSQ